MIRIKRQIILGIGFRMAHIPRAKLRIKKCQGKRKL
jgi:hypothetical protein